MKAVIPAAGLGTRMLPATKSMPKEMLPVVDKPVIQYVVEEAVEAGADEVLLVTGRGKRAIEDHFDVSFELEHHLRAKGKEDVLERVRAVSDLVQVHYVRQPEPRGLGHAVLCAKRFVGEEPFLVLLGDDIMVDAPRPSRQLVEAHEELEGSHFSVMPVDREEIHRYGSLDGSETDRAGTWTVEGIVEKPPAAEAPSLLATIGRYLFTPRIFEFLETQDPDAGGEVQLTDAMHRMAQEDPMHAVTYDGTRLDVGNVEGFVEANVRLALRRKGLQGLRAALRDALE